MFDKRNAGKPFTPDRDGFLAFASHWCVGCTRNPFSEKFRNYPTCTLPTRQVERGAVDEWTHNDIGQPICTAFDPLPDYQQWQTPERSI